jgi:hypothetical protein
LRIKGQYPKISKGEIGRLKELWKDTPNIDNCEHCVDIETNVVNQRGKTLVPGRSTAILPTNEKKIWPLESRLTK